MNRSATLLLAFLAPLAAAAQTTPAKPVAKPATKPATAATHSAASTVHRTTTTGIKLPPGVPAATGPLHTAFALRYQEIKVGTGAPAEPGKLYTVHYTGWLASDGKKFDSSYDHRRPVLDADGKPQPGPNGMPKLGDPEPIQFPQGRRGVIPGWDQGFEGMHIGGKRRLFIPYQLAYGELGRPPVIPPKSDLIFDIELIDVKDIPQQSGMPFRPQTTPQAAAPAKPADTPAKPATPAPTPAPGAPQPEKPTNPAQPK